MRTILLGDPILGFFKLKYILSIFLMFLLTMSGPNHASSNESRNTSNHMDDASSCKIVKALATGTLNIAEPASTPAPSHNHRVNEACHNSWKGEIGR